MRAEATNVLRRLAHRKQITPAEANAAFEDLMLLDLESFSFDPFAGRIWELRHRVSSYEAWYVAVAEAVGLPLATLDERLPKATGPTCDSVTPLGFPLLPTKRG